MAKEAVVRGAARVEGEIAGRTNAAPGGGGNRSTRVSHLCPGPAPFRRRRFMDGWHGSRLGDSNIAVVECDSPVRLGEITLPHRRDNRPVLPHRTTLVPPPAEAKRLERDSRNPDRREEMASPAADDQIRAEAIALPPGDDGADDVDAGDDEKEPAFARRYHDLRVTRVARRRQRRPFDRSRLLLAGRRC